MRRKTPVFKIVLVLVLVPVLAAVGIYFYVTRQVENELARFASQISPVGTLEWEDVQLHPSGQLRVRKLHFAPHLVAVEIRTEQIAFIAPNLIDLLQATREFDSGRLPNSLGLAVRGLEIPLEGSVINQFDQTFSTGLPFESAGCGEGQGLLVSDLPDLGLWELVTDLNLDYQLINEGEALQLRLGSHTRHVAGMTLDARIHLGSGSRDLDLLVRAGSMARLERMDVTYRDLDFRDRLNRFCADRLDITPDQFKARHLQAWSSAWAIHGLAPSDDLTAAYRQFIAEPEFLQLEARPEQRLPLTAFTRLEHEELLEQLGLTLSVNDDARFAVEFDIVPAVTPPRAAAESTPGDEDEPEEFGQRRQIRWTEIPASEASRHVGESIRITTTDGDRVVGELIGTDTDALRVRVRGVGGFAIRPFDHDRIESIEVRR